MFSPFSFRDIFLSYNGNKAINKKEEDIMFDKIKDFYEEHFWGIITLGGYAVGILMTLLCGKWYTRLLSDSVASGIDKSHLCK